MTNFEKNEEQSQAVRIFWSDALFIAQKQPKSLPPDKFSGLKKYGKCVFRRGSI